MGTMIIGRLFKILNISSKAGSNMNISESTLYIRYIGDIIIRMYSVFVSSLKDSLNINIEHAENIKNINIE